MTKTTILFDLDGTLTDPKEGITVSLFEGLKKNGIDAGSPDKLTHFIGPPLRDVLFSTFGLEGEACERVVKDFRARFAEKGIFENSIYPGIAELLKSLFAKGMTLALATSKPEVYAEKILCHFGIRDYFSHVCGAELDGRRSVKAEVIAYALNQMGNPASETVLMVGDSRFDAEGAKAHGIDTIGVLYGYGTRDELLSAGAKFIAASAVELAEIIEKLV